MKCSTRYRAAGFELKALKNRLRKPLIGQTGASSRGRRPGFQPQLSIRCSTFGSWAMIEIDGSPHRSDKQRYWAEKWTITDEE